jgi:hypothetical protein
MRALEYAVDIWDLRGMDSRLNSRLLHEHLQEFGAQGWELAWMSLNVELADHQGPCHLLVFARNK